MSSTKEITESLGFGVVFATHSKQSLTTLVGKRLPYILLGKTR